MKIRIRMATEEHESQIRSVISIEDLMFSWGVDYQLVKRIIEADSIEELPQELQDLSNNDDWEQEQADILDHVCGTYGAETLELMDEDDNPIRVEYLNKGDTYDQTLCRVGSPDVQRPFLVCEMGPWHVAAWGDYAEAYIGRE